MVDQLSDDELAGLLTGLRAMRAAVRRLHEQRETTMADGGAAPLDPATGVADDGAGGLRDAAMGEETGRPR